MSTESKTAEEMARRIADSESIDLGGLGAEDAALASGLRKLASLAQAMRVGSAAGSSWGHLQQLQLAGQGGFGEVFRAYDPTLDRTVALKLKREDSATLHSSGRDFVAEARRLARVRHPHVLAVHGASYHDGRAGLWADWIDGETLRARLQRSGPVHGSELLRVLGELADALQAVHAAGLVHGDIKASNVMLDTEHRVVLMDFGAGFESGTEGNQISAGTPQYLAPEVLSGIAGTAAVDLYAYGVLAHRLATGIYPHEATVDATLEPRALRQLIVDLLQSDPIQRPSAEQLRHRLRRLVGAPARRLRNGLLAAIVIGLLGITIAVAIGLQREFLQRQQAERARDDATATAAFLTELLAAPAPEIQGREIRVVELLDTAALRTQSQTGLSLQTRAQLLLTIGRSQLALNKAGIAAATLKDARAQVQANQSVDASTVLEINLALARAHERLSQYDEVETVLSAVTADPRWGDDAVGAAQVAIIRSGSLLAQGKIDEAGHALETAWARQKDLPPKVRLAALVQYSHLSFAQRKLERTEQTVTEALELIKSRQMGFGATEFELRSVLGNVYTEMGRLTDAEKIYRDLVTSVSESYGEKSPISLLPWVNVAIVLSVQGRNVEAEALIRELLPKVEALIGGESVTAIQLRSTLAASLGSTGQSQAALAELDTLIDLDQRVFGAQHPQTLIDRFNRIEALNNATQHELALQDGTVLRVSMLARFGEGHPFVLETDDAIGFALTALGRAAEAEPMHRRTLAEKTKALGADSPFTLISSEYLARALIANTRHQQAAELLTALLSDRERVLGAAHSKTEATRKLLASLPPR